MNFDARRYQPTWRRQHVLLSTLLTLQSGTVGQDVPGYFTYYLGGANTIRGYSVEDLGPKLNGKNQLVTTAEYNFNLLPLARRDIFKWSYSIGLQLALFSDLGIAWSEPGRFHGRDDSGRGRARGCGSSFPVRSRCGSTSAGARPEAFTSISPAGPSPPTSGSGSGNGAPRPAWDQGRIAPPVGPEA